MKRPAKKGRTSQNVKMSNPSMIPGPYSDQYNKMMTPNYSERFNEETASARSRKKVKVANPMGLNVATVPHPFFKPTQIPPHPANNLSGGSMIVPHSISTTPMNLMHPFMLGTMPMMPSMTFDKSVTKIPFNAPSPQPAMNKPKIVLAQHVKNVVHRFNSNRVLYRLKRTKCVLELIDKAMNKVEFSMTSIFRIRSCYKLLHEEAKYLSDINKIYRSILFLYLLNGFKEDVAFDISAESHPPIWRKDTFNDSFDASIIGGTGPSILFQVGWIPVKWDDSSSVSYINGRLTLTRGEGNKKKEVLTPAMLVIIKGMNSAIIAEALETIKLLSSYDRCFEDSFLRMLGYYSLTCNDECYVNLISSILPSLSTAQLLSFYTHLSNLLGNNMQTIYLERFMERILPLCFSHEMKSWPCIITQLVKCINPLKLGVKKKHTNFTAALLRSLKSYCSTFVNCHNSCYVIFNFCLQLILQSSDDSRILIRGEATDLANQIWLNEQGKRNVIKSMDYDTMRILATLSGIQSIKLNIWSDLLRVSSNLMTHTSSVCTVKMDNLLNELLSKCDYTAIDTFDYNEALFIYKMLGFNVSDRLEKDVPFPAKVNASGAPAIDDSGSVSGSAKEVTVTGGRDDMNGHYSASKILSESYKASPHHFYWYMNQFLRVTKTSIALEKIPTVIRFILLSCSGVGFKRGLSPSVNIGALIIWLYSIVYGSHNSLEIANFKTSIFMDWLFYNHRKNYFIISHQNSVESAKRDDIYFIDSYCILHEYKDVINSILKQGGENRNLSSPLVYPVENQTFLGVSELLTHIINSSIEFGRVLLDYLVNLIYNYHPNMSLLLLNVVVSILLSSIVSINLEISNLQALTKEIKHTILGKIAAISNISLECISFKVNNGTETLNLSGNTKFNEDKYHKIVSASDKKEQPCYDPLLKHIIIQTYTILVEFYINRKHIVERDSSPAGTLAHWKDNTNLQRIDTDYTFKKLTCISIEPCPDIEDKTALTQPMSDHEDSTDSATEKIPAEQSSDTSSVCSVSSVSLEPALAELADEEILQLVMAMDVEFLSKYALDNLKAASFPTYLLQCKNGELDDNLKGLDSLRCIFRPPQGEDTHVDYKIGKLLDIIISSMVLPTFKCDYKTCNENKIREEVLNKFWIKFFINISFESQRLFWELLYYIAALSIARKSFKTRYGKQAENCDIVLERKILVSLSILFKSVQTLKTDHTGEDTGILGPSQWRDNTYPLCTDYLNQDDLNNALYSILLSSITECTSQESQVNFTIVMEKLMPIRLTLEVLVHDEFLWTHFSKIPCVVGTLIKVTPISALMTFLSTFPSLSIRSSGYALGYSESNFNFFSNTISGSWYYVSRLMLQDVGTDPIRFRQFFITMQLLVRMYEITFSTRKMRQIICDDRNFMKAFTTAPVMLDQFGDVEYLTRDFINYLLNSKEISNDKSCVCLIGSSKTRSNFITYAKAYTFRDEVFNNDMLEILSRLLVLFCRDYRNISMLQVVLFSILPVLLNSIPKDSVIVDIIDTFSLLDGIKKGPHISAYKFLKFMLFTVLLFWFHKHTPCFYKVSKKCTFTTQFVSEFIEKYQNDNITFNFNSINLQIPTDYVQLLQLKLA